MRNGTGVPASLFMALRNALDRSRRETLFLPRNRRLRVRERSIDALCIVLSARTRLGIGYQILLRGNTRVRRLSFSATRFFSLGRGMSRA